METAIILIDFFTFLIGLTLGFFVFLHNPKNQIFQIFGITVLGMAGWNLSIFLLLAGIGPSIIPGRLTFSFGVLLLTGFAWFVFHFPTRMKGARVLSWIYGVLGLIFFAIPLTPWFVTHVELVNGNITGDLDPALFGISTLYYLVSYLVTFGILAGRVVKAKGVDKKRLGQVLLGFSLFLFPMLTTQLFLPLAFNDFRFNNIGPAFSIFLVAFLANAILRYRLLNIRWIIGQSIFFSILVALVIWVVTTTTFLVTNLVDTPVAVAIGALVIVLLYKPLEKGLDKLMDKLVNRGWYDPEEATKELFEIVRQEGAVDRLVQEIGERFESYFSLNDLAIVVLQPEGHKILSQYIIGFEDSVLGSAKQLAEVAGKFNHQILEAGELEWAINYSRSAGEIRRAKKFLPLLRSANVETVIPLVVDDKAIGLMLFGDRRYDRALRDQDIQFLDLIRSGISPALENAAKFAQIKELYEQLAESDRVKTEFISVVSHRFRTPLSALRWNLETVLDGASRMTKGNREMLQDAQNRTMFLVNTLEGLFDALALESGELKLNKAEFNVKRAFDPIALVYQEKAAEKDIVLSASIQNVRINGDEKRLAHVLDILLANAVQYTEKGQIQLDVQVIDGKLQIQIEDTGTGIGPKDQAHIFEKFYRGRGAKNQYADGQGLGLYLVKELVRLHKGSVELVSKAGKGTTFTVRLPKK